MKRLKFIGFLTVIICSCNPDKVDTTGVKEEMEKFKIKKITQAEIMEQSQKHGAEIFKRFQVEIVNTSLDSALNSGDFEKAIKACIYSDYSQKAAIEKEYESQIDRAGLPSRLRNSANAPDSLQLMILEAYQYNKEKGLELFNDAQIQEKEILYNQPIMLDQESCLKCHGNPETEIGKENYQKILKLYPNDKSVNFKKGDVIGVFTVRMDKQALIRSIK